MTEIYSYRGLRNRDVWTDCSTTNIPWYYYAVHFQLANAVSLWSEGTPELVSALRDAAQEFWVTAQGGRRAVCLTMEEG